MSLSAFMQVIVFLGVFPSLRTVKFPCGAIGTTICGMNLPIDPDTVSHGIQLAVAPVFLLTAVSGMIGAVAARLARIIDRARLLEDRIKKNPESAETEEAYRELGELRTRGLLANGSIGLLTLCAFMIGVTIVVLFLGETIDFPGLRISIASFLGGVVCFMMALACFLAETLIATRLLNFAKKRS
jgi:hypothetical protein